MARYGYARVSSTDQDYATQNARLRAASSRGRAVAGCATPTCSAGHTSRRAQADNALTFNMDHPMGAGQARVIAPQTCIRSDAVGLDHDAVMRIGGEAPGGGSIL